MGACGRWPTQRSYGGVDRWRIRNLGVSQETAPCLIETGESRVTRSFFCAGGMTGSTNEIYQSLQKLFSKAISIPHFVNQFETQVAVNCAQKLRHTHPKYLLNMHFILSALFLKRHFVPNVDERDTEKSLQTVCIFTSY
jgi:hypothetical protein